MKTPMLRSRPPNTPVKSWTLAEMLAERPCYPEAKVRRLYGKRKQLSLCQILIMTAVPAVDRLWVAHRPNACTPQQYAAWCERVVLRAVQRHIDSPIAAVALWAQQWVSGEDRTTAAAEAVGVVVAWSAGAAWSAAGVAEQQQQIRDLLVVLQGER